MSIDDLLPLREALMLEKHQLYDIIRKFLPYSEYCANSLMIPEKMNEWCTYLQCDGLKCTAEIVDLVQAKPKVLIPVNINCKLNISVDPILAFNQSCFDDHFCTPIWASKDYHYVLGILGMVLAVLSLIITSIYVVAFRREFGKKHTPAQLLISQALCDILFIVITLAGLIFIYTSSVELVDQLKVYSSIHVYIVLYILPFACFFESLSIWILMLLIFDRYNYLSHGFHSKNLLTKKLCFIFLCGISLILLALAIMRIFKYDIVPIPFNHKYKRLVESHLGRNMTFKNLEQFWLKMPFESLFPLSLVFIIIIMVLHKLIYSGSTNNSKTSFLCVQEHILTKSILFICCVLLAVKSPKLILHILKYEIGIELNSEIVFELVCHLLDQVYLFIKSCLIYKYMCPMFAKWLQDKVCFDSGYRLGDHTGNLLSTIDEYKDLDYGFEKKCKKSIYIDPNFDKETNV